MSNKNKIIIGLASFLVLIAVGFAAKSKVSVKNNSVMEEAIVSVPLRIVKKLMKRIKII